MTAHTRPPYKQKQQQGHSPFNLLESITIKKIFPVFNASPKRDNEKSHCCKCGAEIDGGKCLSNKINAFLMPASASVLNPAHHKEIIIMLCALILFYEARKKREIQLKLKIVVRELMTKLYYK